MWTTGIFRSRAARQIEGAEPPVVLAATDPTALADWLDRNGYGNLYGFGCLW